MKITAIMGSHRNSGHTARVLKHFLGCLEDQSALRIINVNKEEIRPCLGCDYCIEHQAECVIKDDAMTGIYRDIFESDLLVIASPVYFTAFPSKIKALFDRMQLAFNLKNADQIKEKKLIFIGIGGAPSYPHQFDGMRFTLKWFNRYLKVTDTYEATFVHSDVTPALEQKESIEKLESWAKEINEGIF